MPLAGHDIAKLYAPQFEQFDTKLDTSGNVWETTFDNEIGHGNAWIIPLGESCLIMEHNVTPHKDMLLSEFTPVPYACAASINRPTLDCMPQSGIVPRNVVENPYECQAGKSVCTFVQGGCAESISPLKADALYHSRSVIFLPRYFEELDKRYPLEFKGMFDIFGASNWDKTARSCIARTLDQLVPTKIESRGSRLFVRATIEKMVAELAILTAEEQAAQQSDRNSDGAQLALQAAAIIEKATNSGKRINIEEIAAQLYTSKSKLCAVFKEETGQTLAAHAKRLCLEKAEHLLARGDESIATVASKLGYAHQAAFTQAFKQAHGTTPSAWRQLQRKGL